MEIFSVLKWAKQRLNQEPWNNPQACQSPTAGKGYSYDIS